MKKKVIPSLLSLMLAPLLLFTACGGNDLPVETDPDADTVESISESESESESETEAETETETAAPVVRTEYPIKDNLESVNVLGRSSVLITGVTSDWSASGIEFSATYENSIQILCRTTASVQYRVFINGEETGTVSFSSFPLYRDIPGSAEKAGENVTVRLVRISNVESGNNGILTVFDTLKIDGTLNKWTEERKLIEFIGDSITCGCGLVDSTNAFDGSRTYAYSTAVALNADYSMVSVSGIGVSASTSRHNGRTIGTVYRQTNWYRSSETLYTPTRAADLVVVNLNTNDAGNGAVKEGYQEDLRELIASIRAIHGKDVKILWVVGQMIDSTKPVNSWLAEVFAELGGEAAGLYTVTTYKNTSGGASHPNQKSHDDTAVIVAKFIRDNNLLGD